MENRAEVLIDLGAIRENIKYLMAKSGKPALAVVKADGYGHGLLPVAKSALSAGASWLGVALLEEAIALRQGGISAPIIAWLTPITDDFESAINADIDIAIPSLAHLEVITNSARSLGKCARVHLEVDTGMSRGGALNEWGQLVGKAKTYQDSGLIRVIGIWSHFARADELGHEFNKTQLKNFKGAVAEAESVGITPQVIHLSNSAAAINDADSHFDLLRLGIAIYGLSPDFSQMGSSEKLNLKPAMSIRARIHLVKDVPAGSQVGYGGSAITKVDTKLGVIAMGYSDGIPRNANSDAGVLIGNKRAPIIGRVSMDQFVVDLGRDSTAKAGDWAYIIGSNPSDSYTSASSYTADSWASASATINYEIVTRIAARVKRIYQG
ncbi:MAG: alanine racemase [Actinobacteria bacterium]|nr:alanine racemase [Actinomycetota bacterium]